MSKIDEKKLNASLLSIAEYFLKASDLSLKFHQEIVKILESGVIPATPTPEQLAQMRNKETAEPSQTANWIVKQGAAGQFELLNDKNCEEYRILKSELEKYDRPIHYEFEKGQHYTVWLMRDGEAIGRKQLRKKS